MAYTEFCCRSGGSNLNAGTRNGSSTEPGTSPDFQYASGSWVAATRVFTVASGNPLTDGVAVGDFASVYADGSTRTGYVGRVSAVTSTTITIDATAIMGTAPVDGTANRTLRIGGAWQGPVNVVGTEGWPFIVATALCRNVAGNPVRINVKNDQTYRVTSLLTVPANTVFGTTIEGYASTYGDENHFILQGIGTGTGHNIINMSGSFYIYKYLILENNGTSGSVALTLGIGSAVLLYRCIARNSRGSGFNTNNNSPTFIECEAYNNNLSNSAGNFGFGNSGSFIRCSSHDNAGTNSHGFSSAVNTLRFLDCVAYRNTGIGFILQTNSNQGPFTIQNCDAYFNSVDGFRFIMGAGSTSAIVMENCNAVRNGAWGVRDDAAGTFLTDIRNMGVGSGTMANVSGNFDVARAEDNYNIVGTVTYPAGETPWQDPNNGDFRVVHPLARQGGNGTIPQVGSGSSNIVGRPPIGACVGPISGGGLLLPRGFDGGFAG